jgi:hypothetical protein
VIKKLPVIVQLYDTDVHKSNLLKELKIDPHNLDLQLSRQPGRYAFWSELYATVSARVSRLKEELETLEARLYIRTIKKHRGEKGFRVTDAKQFVYIHPKYRRLRKRLRVWMDSERYLRYAEKSFDQRLHCLQSICANTRREKEGS